MVCREVYNLLPDYSAEALPRWRMEQIRAHLIGCPDCSREWAGLRETLRLVEELVPLAPPPGLWQGVLAGIEETEERQGDRAIGRRREGSNGGFSPRRSHGWPWELPRFRVTGAWGLASGVALATVLAAAFWGFRDRPLTPPPPVVSVSLSDPELVAAIQQHSFASAGLLFADRAGLESVVQLVRHQRQP
jgi:hypothetical protein